jgi:hypothetical protein
MAAGSQMTIEPGVAVDFAVMGTTAIASFSAVKFPLLLFGTALLCGLATLLATRFVGAPLPFAAVQRTSSALLRSLAVLLGSTSPAVLLLARTSPLPGPRDLGGYPLFVGLNMVLVGLAGMLAVRQQHRQLAIGHGLPRRQALLQQPERGAARRHPASAQSFPGQETRSIREG